MVNLSNLNVTTVMLLQMQSITSAAVIVVAVIICERWTYSVFTNKMKSESPANTDKHSGYKHAIDDQLVIILSTQIL